MKLQGQERHPYGVLPRYIFLFAVANPRGCREYIADYSDDLFIIESYGSY